MAESASEKPLGKREWRALHEASHAVVSYLLDDQVDDISLVPEPPRRRSGRPDSARSSAAWVPLHDVDMSVIRAVMVHLAGPAADSAVGHDLDAQDTALAAELASRVTSSKAEVRAFLDWVPVRTRELLMMPRNRVATEVLATYLLRKRRLTGTQARSIVRMAIADEKRVLALIGKDLERE